MTWLTAQYNFMKASKLNPYFAAQYFAENSTGVSLIGTVHSYTSGAQLGAMIYHNLNFIMSYDSAPYTAYFVPAKHCKGTASEPTAASPSVVFGGVSDSLNTLPSGDVKCYGGGIASPYTDNQATDPLFTTSLTQGMADVHKPGSSAKAAFTWQTNDRHLRIGVSDAWYYYALPGNVGSVGNGDARSEFDFDAQYFFNHVNPKGPYQGFSIRQRYGDRTQTYSPYDFKYSRTQLEYTF